MRFFEPASFFNVLREYVVPRLRTYPFIRVWNAGCGIGEDAFALAIVLKEAGLLERSRIYATDRDATVFSGADRGELPLQCLDPNAYRSAGGKASLAEYAAPQPGGRVELRPVLGRHIFFAEHDPTREASFNEFQLIFCRAIPGDDPAVRAHALAVFEASLCRLGVIALADPVAAGEMPVAGYERLGEHSGLLRRLR